MNELFNNPCVRCNEIHCIQNYMNEFAEVTEGSNLELHFTDCAHWEGPIPMPLADKIGYAVLIAAFLYFFVFHGIIVWAFDNQWILDVLNGR